MGCCGKIATGAVGLAKAATGIGTCPSDVVKLRRDACRQCENASRSENPKYADNNGLTTLSKCQLCGCFIAAKTKVASESCPADPSKWGAHELDV